MGKFKLELGDWVLYFIELGIMFFNCFVFVYLIVVIIQGINLDSCYFCWIRWEIFYYGLGVVWFP